MSRRPNEFIVAMGIHTVTFMSGLHINLDSVIESEQDNYRTSVETFHEEQGEGASGSRPRPLPT